MSNPPVLTPTNFDQLTIFANMAARSGLVPKDYAGRPEAIMIAVQLGSELGLSPMQSLNSIAVINGRPGVWGDGLLGLCRASPLCEDIVERIDGEGDDRVAVCIAKRRAASPVEGRFSVADAKRAGLWGKAIWAAYPERMLRNRARGFALRDAFPDVLRGLKTGEELMDTPADDWRGPTIEAKTAPIPSPGPVSGSLQDARAEHRAAQQQAAGDPHPKRMTTREFLDTLDRELELAPEASAVHAIMMSERVTYARSFLTGSAADRLSQWTVTAAQKRAALQEAESQEVTPRLTDSIPEPEPPSDPLNAPLPEDIDDLIPWPVVDEPAGD
jgi:hypothetical protein